MKENPIQIIGKTTKLLIFLERFFFSIKDITISIYNFIMHVLLELYSPCM